MMLPFHRVARGDAIGEHPESSLKDRCESLGARPVAYSGGMMGSNQGSTGPTQGGTGARGSVGPVGPGGPLRDTPLSAVVDAAARMEHGQRKVTKPATMRNVMLLVGALTAIGMAGAVINGVPLAIAVSWAMMFVGVVTGWSQVASVMHPVERGERGRSVALGAAGALMAVAGVLVLFSRTMPLGDVLWGALAGMLLVLVLAVIVAPWWISMVSDLGRQRAVAAREELRADFTSRLHDSVLQTLALIQLHADDAAKVSALARSQERDLREWLYGDPDAVAAGSGAGAWAGDVSGADMGGGAAGVVGDPAGVAGHPYPQQPRGRVSADTGMGMGAAGNVGRLADGSAAVRGVAAGTSTGVELGGVGGVDGAGMGGGAVGDMGSRVGSTGWPYRQGPHGHVGAAGERPGWSAAGAGAGASPLTSGPAKLSSRLKRLAAQVEDAREVPIEVVAVGDLPSAPELDPLLRACGEAMVNAAKHGRPPIGVYMEVGGGTVQMFVRDHGDGFDVDAPHEGHLGISSSIVDRMRRAGGTSQIVSRPGWGTEVRLTMPLRGPAHD